MKIIDLSLPIDETAFEVDTGYNIVAGTIFRKAILQDPVVCPRGFVDSGHRANLHGSIRALFRSAQYLPSRLGLQLIHALFNR